MTTQVANEAGIAWTHRVYVWHGEGGDKNCCQSPTQLLSGFVSPFCCFYQLTQSEQDLLQNTFRNDNFQIDKNPTALVFRFYHWNLTRKPARFWFV